MLSLSTAFSSYPATVTFSGEALVGGDQIRPNRVPTDRCRKNGGATPQAEINFKFFQISSIAVADATGVAATTLTRTIITATLNTATAIAMAITGSVGWPCCW